MATTTPTRIAKTNPDDAAAPPGPEKKSKKKLMIIVVVVLVAAVGYFMMGKKSASKAAAPEPGIVVAMDATTLNLADGHFLKLKLAIETVKGAPKEFDTSKAADIAVSEFSNRPMETLATNEARDAVKAELLEKLKKAYKDEVYDVFFTEFVMQ